jgi:hypothetical protein
VFAGTAISLAMLAPTTHAQGTLAYSFETDLEGFNPNGAGGITLEQDTIGATEGSMSMKFSMPQLATFDGALTANLTPEIADPPGLDEVIFDLTITEAFPTAGFVNAGITMFGHSRPDHPNGQQFGLSAQFLNEVPLGDLAPGTHEIKIPLTLAVHPLTFTLGTFNDVFGTTDSENVNDLLPSGFQIFVNKSTQAAWTGYIDDIRLVTTPTLDADFNDDNVVDAADLGIWKNAFASNDMGDADGDMDSDGADFLAWQNQLGPSGGGAAAAPEPSTAALALTVLAVAKRRRRTLAQVFARLAAPRD